MSESDFKYAPEIVKDDWAEFNTEIAEASLKVQREKWEHFTPDFLDTHTGKGDITVITEAVDKRRDIYAAERLDQIEAHVKIPTDMPITAFPIGDIHWGSIFTNNELWNHHRETILKTPGLYVVFMHNLVDNGIPGKFPSNILNNGVPPADQFKVMQTWIKELDEKGKVLGAVTSDCHEGWSWQVAGVDASALLYGYKDRKFPILENGGILHLDVGQEGNEQSYAIGLWHKQGPFNSRFNPEHALRQNRRLYHEGVTDAEVGAHYHNTAASASYEGAKNRMKPVQWIRVGSYKGVPFADEQEFTTDKWIVDRAGVSGQTPGTALTFWDNKHVIDNSLDFETAVEKHMAIRTYALIKEMGLEDKFNQMMSK